MRWDWRAAWTKALSQAESFRMKRLQRIALYGGTFDPVHVGHMAIAQSLVQLFELDEFVFIPAHVAPHKRERRVAPALHRYAMLALATAQAVSQRVSTIELDAPQRPYTIDTLSQIKGSVGQRARLFFVMGADSWMEINTWREWERLLQLTDHIVVTRPGYEFDTSHVTPAIREKIVDLRGASCEAVLQATRESDNAKIYLTDAVAIAISATALRRAACERRSKEWRALVPPTVADYIEKYRLYDEEYEAELTS